MFGYLRVQRLAAGTTPGAISAQLAEYAHSEGYSLAGVFLDQAHTSPAAFDALIEAVKRYDARAIAIPTLEHLAVLGAPPPLREFLQRRTGAQVLVMDPEPVAGSSMSRRDGRADDASASVPPHQLIAGAGPSRSSRGSSDSGVRGVQ